MGVRVLGGDGVGSMGGILNGGRIVGAKGLLEWSV
jgi:hypothetical protein